MKTQIYYLFSFLLSIVSVNFGQDSLFKTIVPEFNVCIDTAGLHNSGKESLELANNSNGVSVLAWVDSRNEDRNIYAQIFSGSGVKNGKNIKVTDNSFSNYSYQWGNVLLNDRNEFIVTWTSNNREFLQRFDKNGNKIGININIDTLLGFNLSNDSTLYKLQYFTFAPFSDGNFLVGYKKNDTDTLFFQNFNIWGSIVGRNFILDLKPEDNYNLIKLFPIKNGEIFYTLWKFNKQYKVKIINVLENEIYEHLITENADYFNEFEFQTIDSNSVALLYSFREQYKGMFKIVLFDNNGTHKNTLEVGNRLDFNVIFLKNEFYVINENCIGPGCDGSGGIYGYYLTYQRYNYQGEEVDNPVYVNSDTGNFEFKFAKLKNEEILVSWIEKKIFSYINNICSQILPKSESTKVPILKINDDIPYAFQSNPDFDISNQKNIITVFEDDRNGNWDIYSKKLILKAI